MFCIQCEQTIQTPAVKGCSFAQGMCGKTSEVSDLQDVLVYTLQGVLFGHQKHLNSTSLTMKSINGHQEHSSLH